MHHDVIADCVDILDPLPLRPFELGKSPEILQRKRGMTREGMQQIPLVTRRRAFPANQA